MGREPGRCVRDLSGIDAPAFGACSPQVIRQPADAGAAQVGIPGIQADRRPEWLPWRSRRSSSGTSS